MVFAVEVPDTLARAVYRLPVKKVWESILCPRYGLNLSIQISKSEGPSNRVLINSVAALEFWKGKDGDPSQAV